jgi:hypothetical protein
MAAPVFALAPALVNDGIIDYATAEGAKLYKAAIDPLPGDAFNCEAHGIKVFLANLEDRASRSGWANIFMIPEDADDPDNNLVDIIHNYGQLTLQQVRDHASTYIDQHNRQAQNNAQLYHCLMNSLTKEAKAKVMIWRRDYTVLNELSGACLLKIIIRESHVDTRSTVLHIREKLSSLDSYIKSIDYDIVKFNTYVKDLLDSLSARGQVTEDLLAFVLKAYKKVPDKDFCDYIKAKQNEYEEGYELDADIIMKQASNKYKALVQDGTWNAPSPEYQKILALEAKIESLQKKGKSNDNQKGKGNNNNRKGGKSKESKKAKKCPDWMLKEPSQADMDKPKKYKGNEYWWCANHKRYVQHKTANCEGHGIRPTSNQDSNADQKSKGNNQNDQPKLKVKQAIEAINESDSE